MSNEFINLSPGSLCQHARALADASSNFIEEIQTNLLNAVEMNNCKKSLVSCHSGGILQEELDRYSARYDELLKQAKEQNKLTSGSIAKSDELSLIRRLETYKSNHLLFASHPEVPFTNNMSERDLRKCKNRQKVSGGFRKDLGKSVYCTLLRVIETCRRRGISFLDHFRQAFRPKFLPC